MKLLEDNSINYKRKFEELKLIDIDSILKKKENDNDDGEEELSLPVKNPKLKFIEYDKKNDKGFSIDAAELIKENLRVIHSRGPYSQYTVPIESYIRWDKRSCATEKFK